MRKKIEKSKLVRVRAPKGYQFKMRDDTYGGSYRYCDLYKKGSSYIIGTITLEPNGNKGFITHSRLDPAYQGKGLGALMYARAIQWCLDNGYKVRSSYSPSDMAQRVWGGSSLRRFFSVKRLTPKTDPYSYKTWSVIKQKKKKSAKKK